MSESRGSDLDFPEAQPAAIPEPEGIENRTCEVCGNTYDKAFQILIGGEFRIFDSFECAIHALAPLCEHCGCRIIGHGVEAEGVFYCCAHCAEQVGEMRLRDRV